MSKFWPNASEDDLTILGLLSLLASPFFELLKRLKASAPKSIRTAFGGLVPNVEMMLILWRIESGGASDMPVMDVLCEASTDVPHEERMAIDQVRTDLVMQDHDTVSRGPLGTPIHLN